jgi:hypothetical protein
VALQPEPGVLVERGGAASRPPERPRSLRGDEPRCGLH